MFDIQTFSGGIEMEHWLKMVLQNDQCNFSILEPQKLKFTEDNFNMQNNLPVYHDDLDQEGG